MFLCQWVSNYGSYSFRIYPRAFSIGQWIIWQTGRNLSPHLTPFHEPAINFPPMPYGGNSCVGFSMPLFIYIPGVASLLVIYVLLCMICCWDLWHGVCRVFGRRPRLKWSHAFKIMWQHSTPSVSISVFCLFFFSFLIYSSKWGMVNQFHVTTSKYLARNYSTITSAYALLEAVAVIYSLWLHKEVSRERSFDLLNFDVENKVNIF